MREEIWKEAEAELEARRSRNEEIARSRFREAVGKDPAIEELARQREEIIYGSMRGILMGQKQAEDLPKQMEAASARLRAALKKNGYPENYLAPVYDCPLCQDTGYVGEPVRRACECLKKAYQEKLRKAEGLENCDAETFEGYDESLFPDQPMEGEKFSQRLMMNLVMKSCRDWAEAYPKQRPRDMVLSGKSGLGKTFLMRCMANRLIERGYPVMMMSAYRFLDLARRSYFGEEEGLEDILEAQVLMLDDLGSEPMMNNVTVEQIFNLINERQRRQLATVISTNLNEEELRSRYTERVASRLTDRTQSSFLALKGRDVRNGRK
jgi:DNA replication protein DnaC